MSMAVVLYKILVLVTNSKSVEPLFSSTRLAIVPPRFSPPLEVFCFTIIFARVRRKHFESPIGIQEYLPQTYCPHSRCEFIMVSNTSVNPSESARHVSNTFIVAYGLG